jgi:hypothetical protein
VLPSLPTSQSQAAQETVELLAKLDLVEPAAPAACLPSKERVLQLLLDALSSAGPLTTQQLIAVVQQKARVSGALAGVRLAKMVCFFRAASAENDRSTCFDTLTHRLLGYLPHFKVWQAVLRCHLGHACMNWLIASGNCSPPFHAICALQVGDVLPELCQEGFVACEPLPPGSPPCSYFAWRRRARVQPVQPG